MQDSDVAHVVSMYMTQSNQHVGIHAACFLFRVSIMIVEAPSAM